MSYQRSKKFVIYSKMKNTEILFNLFSFGFLLNRQHWCGQAVWFEEK